MFCTKCGAPNDDASSFCTGCGAALKQGTSSVPPQPPVNPPKGPGKAIAIAIVLLACIVAVVILVMRPGCSGEPGPGPGSTSSTTETFGPTESANDAAALERVNGWWQSAGQSGSLFHHFVDGIDYVYQRSFDDPDEYTYEATQSYTVEPFEAGQLDFTDNSGVAVHVDGGATYILEDGEEGLLTCRNMDGSGYSGSSSLARPASGDIPQSLVDLVAQVEGGDTSPGSASESVSANPSSLDISGEDKGDVATLTGVVTRQNMTPADTGMIWAAALYYLELPEPVTITYNGPVGDPVTQVFDRILVWSDEANPTMGGEDEYYAEHPEEISTEYDQYLGSTITVSGHIIDAGTAHYFGSGRFIDPEIVG